MKNFVFAKVAQFSLEYGVSTVDSQTFEKQLLTSSSCVSDLRIWEACRRTVPKNLPILFSDVSLAQEERSEQGKGKEQGKRSYGRFYFYLRVEAKGLEILAQNWVN